MKFLLALLLVGCGGSEGFRGSQWCSFDGWQIDEETPRDCSYYRDVVTTSWATLVQRGWVAEADKPKYQTIPIHLFNQNVMDDNGEVVLGRYFQADHIDLTWTAGALAHEWMHHKDFLDGEISFESHLHWDWWTRGALAIDTEYLPPDGPGNLPYLATSWYGTTSALLYSFTPKAQAAFPTGTP